MSASANHIEEYVRNLALPEREPHFEAVLGAEPPRFSDRRELMSVGPQLVEFSDTIAADLRPLIANSMLLAQLAANKATGDAASVFDWHRKYHEVLTHIGWQSRGTEEQLQEIRDQGVTVHKAIVPVLTAMLGPAMAGVSLAVSVLEGLGDMDKSQPWITLFDQSGQHAQGAKFQISHVGADEHGEPTIKLLAFSVLAESRLTQILFFRFSSQKAELHRSEAELNTTVERLLTDKTVIAKRVTSYISDYVSNIEI